jgi:site-specific recombinase XerD
MKINGITDFAYFMTKYLSFYLPGQHNSSKHTILAYRDTFRLLLRYSENVMKIVPEKITINLLNSEYIGGFLLWLEAQGNSIATRKHRLAVIKGFFHYIQGERPEFLQQAQEIFNIKLSGETKETINYLSVEAITEILNLPNSSDKFGLRDIALLGLLYDSGARVSEICGLCPRDLRLDTAPIVTLLGKGRKIRQCPLSKTVSINLQNYLMIWKLNTPDKMDSPLFFNHEGERIGRAGVAYILEKYVVKAREKCPALIPNQVSPHTIRHSKAMHLLQANVNLVYIRDWLGHAHLKTTEVYARADPEMKRTALQKAATAVAPQQNLSQWGNDSDLMTWLNSLG